MLSGWVELVLGNFVLILFLFAIIFILFNFFNARKQGYIYEIVYQWIALLPLGMGCFYMFIMHAFFPVYLAERMGWQKSPFQFEVAMAALAFSLLGLLAFRASYGFRLATVVGSTCWLWGNAISHIYQIILPNHFSAENSGSWLLMDILIPLILIVCIVKLNPINKRLFY